MLNFSPSLASFKTNKPPVCPRASTIRTPAEGYMFIGQFHTLCNGVPANTTAIIPMQTGVTVGTSVTLCDYFLNQDLDFAQFYTKTIDAVNNGTPYAVATVLHPLQGFNTCDILPESVWCLNFHPSCKNWDGMVYCNSGKIVVDIYLQSGTGSETRSEYGAVHADYLNPALCNYDCYVIGKKSLTFETFYKVSLGSNQKTVIQGAADASTVGGHVDTTGRRMISFIGCEECCGYFAQCIFNYVSDMQTIPGYSNVYDGRGFFGTCDGKFSDYFMGGLYSNSPGSTPESGSMCIGGPTDISSMFSGGGGRYCCDVSIV